MYEKLKLHAIASKDPAPLHKDADGWLFAPDCGFLLFNFENNFRHKPYNLYLTSKKKITENKTWATVYGREVWLLDNWDEDYKTWTRSGTKTLVSHESCEMIIATTDLKLFGRPEGQARHLYSFGPLKMPDSLPQHFVKMKGDVDEVLVEFGYLKHPEDPEYTESNCYGPVVDILTNCINWKPMKPEPSPTREQAWSIVRGAFGAAGQPISLEVHEWLDKNYPI